MKISLKNTSSFEGGTLLWCKIPGYEPWQRVRSWVLKLVSDFPHFSRNSIPWPWNSSRVLWYLRIPMTPHGGVLRSSEGVQMIMWINFWRSCNFWFVTIVTARRGSQSAHAIYDMKESYRESRSYCIVSYIHNQFQRPERAGGWLAQWIMSAVVRRVWCSVPWLDWTA